MYFFTIAFFNLSLLVFSYAQNQYCNLPSCMGNPHTMCIFQPRPEPRCGRCYQVGLTQNEINQVVTEHNIFRQNVALGRESRGNPGPQPRAAPGAMNMLSWNNELAMIAQTWANQCMQGHDKCRNTPTTIVGQNSASQWNTNPAGINILAMVQRWYNEVDLFSRNSVQRYQFSPATGHYTQIIWGTTKYIGCGFVKCDTGMGTTVGNLVCNYGPSGNWQNQAVYKT